MAQNRRGWPIGIYYSRRTGRFFVVAGRVGRYLWVYNGRGEGRVDPKNLREEDFTHIHRKDPMYATNPFWLQREYIRRRDLELSKELSMMDRYVYEQRVNPPPPPGA